MATNDMDRVVPLGQLDDFKVAEGDPDVRGWEVMASDGRKIGEVDELLVDTTAMKVRYLDVDVDDGVMGDGQDRHVLIPIGYARLERDRDTVMVDGLASADLQGLPAYDQGPLTRDFESSVRDSFSGRGTTSAGMTGAGAGMVDTAGLDNTPGTGTGMGLGATGGLPSHGEDVSTGAGMRAAGYDLDRGTGSEVRDTGSMRTGLDSDLGTTGGVSAGGISGGGLSAGGTSGGGMSSGSGEMGATARGAGLGGTASGDDTLAGGMSAGAGAQGPVSGMGTEMEPRGDASHRSSGLAGSDYLHNADEDFYASDAFNTDRFYGARRSGTSGTSGMGGTPQSSTGDPGGVSDMRTSATREEVRDLAQDARDLLRQDHQNRDVGGTGNR